MTETARDLVRRIPDQPMLAPTAGLRIFRRPGSDDALRVQAEDRPRTGDQVVDCEGARVFLGARAVPSVRNKVLDARLDAAGRIEFLLTAEAPTGDGTVGTG